MKGRIVLHETATGREATVIDILGADPSAHRFFWEEGNAACDCNRELYFRAAIEGVWPEDSSPECGEVRYQLVSYEVINE